MLIEPRIVCVHQRLYCFKGKSERANSCHVYILLWCIVLRLCSFDDGNKILAGQYVSNLDIMFPDWYTNTLRGLSLM